MKSGALSKKNSDEDRTERKTNSSSSEDEPRARRERSHRKPKKPRRSISPHPQKRRKDSKVPTKKKGRRDSSLSSASCSCSTCRGRSSSTRSERSRSRSPRRPDRKTKIRVRGRSKDREKGRMRRYRSCSRSSCSGCSSRSKSRSSGERKHKTKDRSKRSKDENRDKIIRAYDDFGPSRGIEDYENDRKKDGRSEASVFHQQASSSKKGLVVEAPTVDWRHFMGTTAQKAELQPLNRGREIIPPRGRTVGASGQRASADKATAKAKTVQPPGRVGDRHDDHDDEDDEDASGGGSHEGSESDDDGSGRRHASSSDDDAVREAPSPPAAPSRGIPHRKKVAVNRRMKGKQLALSDDDTSGSHRPSPHAHRPSISPETAKRTSSKRSKNGDFAAAPISGGSMYRSAIDEHAETLARLFADVDELSPERGDVGAGGIDGADDGAATGDEVDTDDIEIATEEIDGTDDQRQVDPTRGKVARHLSLPVGSGGPRAALSNMSPLDAPPSLDDEFRMLDDRRHTEALLIEQIEANVGELRRSTVVSGRHAKRIARRAVNDAGSEELVAAHNSFRESELRRAELEANLATERTHWASRQQTWSSREQEFASREQELASREQEFSSREQEFATHRQDWASREQTYIENEKKSSNLLTVFFTKFKDLAAKYHKLKSSYSCSSQASRHDK